MSAIVIAAAEAVGHGVARTATELASLAWLAIIGVPETLGHATNFIRWCRDRVSRCLDRISHDAIAAPWTDKEDHPS